SNTPTALKVDTTTDIPTENVLAMSDAIAANAASIRHLEHMVAKIHDMLATSKPSVLRDDAARGNNAILCGFPEEIPFCAFHDRVADHVSKYCAIPHFVAIFSGDLHIGDAPDPS